MDYLADSMNEGTETPIDAEAKRDLLGLAFGVAKAESDRSPGVLLIEDDPIMLKAMEHGLRKRGFAVWTALEGKEGVDLYRRFEGQIDVVLSDVQMPGMDGPETLATIRKENPMICFCFMTADIRRSTAQRLLALGALHVFTKPFPSVAGVAEELWTIATNPQDFSSIGWEPDSVDGGAIDVQRPGPTDRRQPPRPTGFLQRMLTPLLWSSGNSTKEARQNPASKAR